VNCVAHDGGAVMQAKRVGSAGFACAVDVNAQYVGGSDEVVAGTMVPTMTGWIEQ
jgi:hypothetical protein